MCFRPAINSPIHSQPTILASSTEPLHRPERFLARAPSDAAKRRLRNPRSGAHRLRICPEISARDPVNRSRPPENKVDDDASGIFARNQGGYAVTPITDQEARRRFTCELDP